MGLPGKRRGQTKRQGPRSQSSKAAIIAKLVKRRKRDEARDAKKHRKSEWAARQKRERLRLQSLVADRLAQLTNGDIAELEQRIGIPHATVQGWWQQGKAYSTLPSAEALSLIAARYNVTIDWLLGRTDSTPAADVVDRLADHVAQCLAAELNINLAFARAVIPDLSSYSTRVVDECRNGVELAAAEKRRFDQNETLRLNLFGGSSAVDDPGGSLQALREFILNPREILRGPKARELDLAKLPSPDAGVRPIEIGPAVRVLPVAGSPPWHQSMQTLLAALGLADIETNPQPSPTLPVAAALPLATSLPDLTTDARA